MKRTYINLPAHYRVEFRFFAFLLDLAADATTITGDISLKIDGGPTS